MSPGGHTGNRAARNAIDAGFDIGIAHGHVGREVDADVKMLIYQADEKLLVAKAAGRNRIEL